MNDRNNELWQDLIEAKNFDELSNSERSFVLGQSTEDNFRLERTILLESKMIYVYAEPLPLILEKEKKGIVILLYQTILAIAASFILAFFLFRSNETITEIGDKQKLATTDTVYVDRLIIDTLVQTKTEYVQLAANQPQVIMNDVQPIEASGNPSSVLSSQSSFEADLSTATLANKGASAANDETLVLMEEWVGPN